MDKQLNLIIENDRASQNRAEKALADVDAKAQNLGDSLRNTTAKATGLSDALAKAQRSRALDDLAEQAARGEISTSKLESSLLELGASEKEIDRVAQSVVRLGRAFQDADAETIQFQNRLKQIDDDNSRIRNQVGITGDVDSALQTGAAGLRTFGGDGAANLVGGAGDIFAVAEGVAQLQAASKGLPAVLKATVQAIGASGFGLIGATLALAGALAVAQKEYDKARKGLEATLSSQNEYFRLIQTETTESLNQKKLETQQNLEAAQSALAFFEAQKQAILATDGAEGALIDFFNGLDKLGISVGEGGANFDTLNQFIEDNRAEVAGLTQDLEVFDRALGSAEVAENDARAALERRNEELRREAELAQLLTDSKIEEQRQAIELINSQNVTADIIRERIASLENERASLNAVIQTFGISEQAQRRYSDRIIEIDAALNILNTDGQRRIEALEAETEVTNNSVGAIQSRIQAVQGFLDRLNQAANAVQDAGQKALEVQKQTDERLSSIQRNTSKRLGDIQNDLLKAQTTAAETLAQGLAQAETDAVNARVTAANERAVSLVELEKDIIKQRRDIINQSKTALFNAVASRDALAAFQAQQARDNELEALKETENERRSEIETQYQQQKEAINQALIEQTALVNARYQEQIQAAIANADEQRQAVIANAVEQRNEVIAASEQQLTAIRSNLQQQIAEIDIFQRQGTGLIQNFVSNALSALGGFGALNGLGGGTNNSFTINPSLTVNNTAQGNGNLTPGQAAQVRTEINNTLGNLLGAAIQVGGAAIRNAR